MKVTDPLDPKVLGPLVGKMLYNYGAIALQRVYYHGINNFLRF